MYKIIRFYKKSGRRKVIKTVSTLEIAQLHCRDPRTMKAGVWFDGYEACSQTVTERQAVYLAGKY